MFLFFILRFGHAASESSLLNGTTKGSDGANSRDDKVCFLMFKSNKCTFADR